MISRREYSRYLYFWLLICSFLLVVYLVYHTSLHTLDSDASSELVLAKHLAQTNRLISEDWFYSTELRVLNTQLIYAPLFKIFDSFRKVRFAGALILTGIMWLSYGYLARQLKLKLNTFLVSSAVLILPTSIAYARITLFHSYYAPHISISFLIIGLFLSICDKKSSRPVLRYAKIAACLILCFLSTLGGIRQLLITVLPLCLTVLIKLYQSTHLMLKERGLRGYIKEFKNYCDKNLKTAFYLLIPTLLVGLIGYVVNLGILSNIYTFTDHADLTLKAPGADIAYGLLNGLLSLFGYNPGTGALSVYGILSMLSVIAFVVVLLLIINSARKKGTLSASNSVIFFISTFAINTFLFFITRNYFPLYYIPVLVYLIPMLAVLFDAESRTEKCKFSIRNLVIGCIAVLCCFNSFASAYYIINKTEDVNIQYTGLTYGNIHIVRDLAGVVDFLLAQSYSYGFAAFWNSNILTEMSNDAIKVSPVSNDFSSYDEWLTLRYYQDDDFHSGKTFVLFSKGDMERVAPETHPFYSEGKEVYSDSFCTVLHFDDVRDIQAHLKNAVQ